MLLRHTQIRKQLLMKDIFHFCHRLQFDYDFIFNKNIQTEINRQNLTVIHDIQLNLTLNPKSIFTQLIAQSCFINRLKQTWSQFIINLINGSNDLIRYLIFCHNQTILKSSIKKINSHRFHRFTQIFCRTKNISHRRHDSYRYSAEQKICVNP